MMKDICLRSKFHNQPGNCRLVARNKWSKVRNKRGGNNPSDKACHSSKELLIQNNGNKSRSIENGNCSEREK